MNSKQFTSQNVMMLPRKPEAEPEATTQAPSKTHRTNEKVFHVGRYDIIVRKSTREKNTPAIQIKKSDRTPVITVAIMTIAILGSVFIPYYRHLNHLLTPVNQEIQALGQLND